eukprot:5756637-Pleurochrysis_carterae.AAC.1
MALELTNEHFYAHPNTCFPFSALCQRHAALLLPRAQERLASSMQGGSISSVQIASCDVLRRALTFAHIRLTKRSPFPLGDRDSTR